MLKTIRYHLSEDKSEQDKLEQQLESFLTKRFEDNRAAFQVVMPNLAVAFQESVIDDYGLFCNKEGELNLTSRSNSQVVYDLHPEQESKDDIEQFLQDAPVVNLVGEQVPAKPLLRSYQMPESNGFVPALPMEPITEDPDTVVMFGLGLGHSLEHLMERCTPSNIIIYEPNIDFFRGSIRVADWKKILLDAEKRGIRLFMQLGQNGLNIGEDLKQLNEAFGSTKVYLYKHYHEPAMDVVYDYLLSPDFNFQSLITGQVQLPSLDHVTHYLPYRAGKVRSSVDRDLAREKVYQMKSLKEKNLKALAVQFPEIYEQLKDYTPQYWQAFIDDSGELNVYHEQRFGALYHANPKELARQAIQAFSEEPNRNDMFAGYKGGKLWKYRHFRCNRFFGKLFEELESDGQFIPDTVSSLIWFGLGLGYPLEPLFEDYDIKSLYIYEPNPEFLYWSLFTTPWHEILPAQREKGTHLYINVGDDGTYIQEDMFSQFHSEGGYLTASAFFFSPMYYPSMQPHINQLRRDFESYLMLSEYFDHVRFNISHTKANLKSGAEVLKYGAKINPDLANTPIMIVGNGPSLDDTIALLKERQHEFLIISCGTALKPLYEAGITPDFHTEVEQNRATYQWITQIPDRDWLKQISLLSLASLHPETVALFKEQLMIFKHGEAGTEAFLRYAEHRKVYATLDYCYPTVANMAVSAAIFLGFKNLYLTGVDLGFKSVGHHHSKSSAYYTDSDESWHDYEEVAGEGIPIRGNLSDNVRTKYEFQLACRIMTQLLRQSKGVQVTNTSDGAFIEGSVPKLFSDLEKHDTLSKTSVKQAMRQELFTREQVEVIVEAIENRESEDKVLPEMDELWKLHEKPVATREEALKQLEREKLFLIELYKRDQSIWFYLIFSSAHFISAALIRLLYLAKDNDQAIEYYEKGLEVYRDFLTLTRKDWLKGKDSFDETVVKSLLSKEEQDALDF